MQQTAGKIKRFKDKDAEIQDGLRRVGLELL